MHGFWLQEAFESIRIFFKIIFFDFNLNYSIYTFIYLFIYLLIYLFIEYGIMDITYNFIIKLF